MWDFLAARRTDSSECTTTACRLDRAVCQDAMKASRSVLMVSAWVVGMP